MNASDLRELRRRARASAARTPAALIRALPSQPSTPALNLPAARLLPTKAPFAQRRFAWAGVLTDSHESAHLTA